MGVHIITTTIFKRQSTRTLSRIDLHHVTDTLYREVHESVMRESALSRNCTLPIDR